MYICIYSKCSNQQTIRSELRSNQQPSAATNPPHNLLFWRSVFSPVAMSQRWYVLRVKNRVAQMPVSMQRTTERGACESSTLGSSNSNSLGSTIVLAKQLGTRSMPMRCTTSVNEAQ